MNPPWPSIQSFGSQWSHRYLPEKGSDQSTRMGCPLFGTPVGWVAGSMAWNVGLE